MVFCRIFLLQAVAVQAVAVQAVAVQQAVVQQAHVIHYSLNLLLYRNVLDL